MTGMIKIMDDTTETTETTGNVLAPIFSEYHPR
jgi:hypothetical protein